MAADAAIVSTLLSVALIPSLAKYEIGAGYDLLGANGQLYRNVAVTDRMLILRFARRYHVRESGLTPDIPLGPFEGAPITAHAATGKTARLHARRDCSYLRTN
jgi:hypothetical protein